MPKNFLSQEDARKVLEGVIRNIIKKVAAGKPLTAAELRELKKFEAEEGGAPSSPAEPEFVGSYLELGKLVGLHRASFPRIRKAHPDAPKPAANGKHSVKEWRAFLGISMPANGAGAPGGKGPANANAPRDGIAEAVLGKAELEREKLLEQIRDIRFRNDREEGRYYPKADVDEWIANLIEMIKGCLESKLRNELPPHLVGLTAPEITARMTNVIESVCDLIRKGPEE